MAGQIIQRGERRWLVRIFLGRDEAGKRTYVSKTIHGTKKDAQAYLNKNLVDRDQGNLVQPTKESLNKFLNRWMLTVVRHRVRERTCHEYERILARYVRPELGLRRLVDLRPEHVQNLYAGMTERGLSGRTVRYTHAVLRNALGQAVKWRRIPSNPADHVDLPRQKQKEASALTVEQVGAFLTAAESSPFGTLFLVAVTTGMRPSEYYALRWDPDVDLDKGQIIVQRTLSRVGKEWKFEEPKTERSRRTVPVSASVVKALRAHRAKQAEQKLFFGAEYEDNGLVFATEKGTPLEHRNLVTRHFKRALKAAGLPETIRLYDLRHTAATILIAEGEDARTVADRLGHAQVSLTLGTYTHVRPDMQRRAAERLEQVLFAR